MQMLNRKKKFVPGVLPSGKENVIRAEGGVGGEGGRHRKIGNKTRHFVEVFVSSMGPRVFRGWCLVILHSRMVYIFHS